MCVGGGGGAGGFKPVLLAQNLPLNSDVAPIKKYSRLSLSRIPRDFLKYFEIAVPRHIRFAELRKNNSNNHI